MDRRQFLAAGGTFGAAIAGGCVGCATAPSLWLSMEETSDDDITDRLTETVHPDVDSHRVAIEAIDGPVPANGTTEPFDTDTPYRYNNTVYTAETTVLDEQPGTTFSYGINPVDGDETVPSEHQIGYEDLPSVDKEAFSDRGWDAPDPFLGYRTSVHYLEENIANSVLVSEPGYEVIVWPETRGRFEVNDQVDQPLTTYEYTTEVVADPAAGYGREVRQHIEFELGPFHGDSRTIVEEAIADPPYTVPAGGELSEGETAVVDQFRGEEQLRRLNGPQRDPELASGRYLPRYDGQIYLAEVVG